MSSATSASGVSLNLGISPPERNFTIAIIGGGLAGLTLAIGLSNQGVPIHIYESKAAFAEIGAGVIIGPNAAKVLGLIDPRISEGYQKCATINSSEERRETWLSFRWGQDCRRTGQEGKAGDLIRHLDWKGKGYEDGTRTFNAMHRARFLDEMIKLLPEGLTTFGKCLKDIVEVEHGVELTFEDGSSAEHSAVIGCDGIKSRTRQIMYPEIVPRFAGEYMYRALVPRVVANEVLGEERAGNSQVYCGYGGNMVSFPVDQGKLVNFVAIKGTEAKEWGHEQWVIPSSTEDTQGDFEGWEPKLVDLISRFESKDRWAIFDVVVEKSYAKGQMCLVGDAAHASTPHLGAGAGMAFEDAYIMSNLLGAVRNEREVPAAFQAFDAARRKRTLRVVLDSRRAGLANKLSIEGVTDDVPSLEKDLDLRWRWVWEVDYEIMRREALAKMHQLL